MRRQYYHVVGIRFGRIMFNVARFFANIAFEVVIVISVRSGSFRAALVATGVAFVIQNVRRLS